MDYTYMYSVCFSCTFIIIICIVLYNVLYCIVNVMKMLSTVYIMNGVASCAYRNFVYMHVWLLTLG